MAYSNVFNSIDVYPHHLKQNICATRSKYRDGKKDTAVKVYTINQESIYIIITNVPAVGGSEELRALCDQYGHVDDFRPLDDYPCEEFTEVYLVKYNAFPSARIAKRYLDDKSFLGGTLHVFYAPEFETVNETRMKLQERRKYVAWKTKKSLNTPQNKLTVPQTEKNKVEKQSSSSAVNMASSQPVTYVWAGKEYTVYPEASAPATEEPVLNEKPKAKSSSNFFVPRQLKQKISDGSSSSHFTENPTSYPSNANLSHVDESSYLNTISHVRSKISNVAVPNVRVSLKRKRRV